MKHQVKKITVLLVTALFLLASLTPYYTKASDSGTSIVRFNDANLEKAVRNALNLPNGDITQADMRRTEFTELVASNAGITDLTGLEFAANLRVLHLGHNKISDLRAISGLNSLVELYIQSNKITDISPLKNLVKLQNMAIGNNLIIDIGGLSNLTELKFLAINDNNIDNIWPVTNMTKLEALIISGNRVNDLNPIGNCTQLKHLNLNGNRVNFIGPLSSLANLEELFLGWNEIGDIYPISGLSNLKELVANNNYINDIAPVSNLNSLEKLGLGFNMINNIEPIESLVKLQKLVLDNNWIENIFPIEKNVNNGGFSSGDKYISIKNNLLDISENSGTLQAINVIKEKGIAVEYEPQNGTVHFNDASLEQIVKQTLGIQDRGVYISEMERLTDLYAENMNISDLTGLEYAVNLKQLMLNNNNISDISPVQNLTQLESLQIENNRIKDISAVVNLTKLNALGLGNNQISDINPMSNLANLMWTSIWNNEINDITPLQNLTNLRGLWADRIGVSDITPLQNLSNLESLGIEGNNISNITALSNLHNLKELYLSDNNVSNISPISNMVNLERLALRKDWDYEGDKIESIDSLSKLSKLTMIDLGGNAISDITPLTNLTQVNELYLWGNQIADIHPLAKLTKLNNLDISGNKLSDISVLSGLKSLARLYIEDLGISSITPVTVLTNLRDLSMSYNNIPDIKQLTKLTNLERLSMRRNHISDIAPLGSLANLKEIDFEENENISDISVLSKLTKLERVMLSGNRVSDISPVSGLKNLVSIGFGGNNISDITPLENLTKLNDANLSGNSISSILPLANLTSLNFLDICFNRITSIKPLVINAQNGGFAKDPRYIKISHNNIDDTEGSESSNDINTLRDMGINIDNDEGQDDGYTPVETVAIDTDNISIRAGETAVLHAAVKPDDATNKNVIWSSDNTSIADVKYGKVTGIKPGTAKITVTTEDGAFEDSCTVTVNPQPLTEIKLNQKSIKIGKNQGYKLSYILNPINASVEEITWESEDESVATVDSEGTVTGLDAGTANITITVKTPVGSKSAVCSVTVVPVEKIAFSKPVLTLKAGATSLLKATITPSGAVNKGIIWESSDESIVSVDSTGKITALKDGEAVVYAKSAEDENISGECNIKVDTPVASVKFYITKLSLSTLPGHRRFHIDTLMLPENAGNRSLKWYSSNMEVADVDQDGIVTAKKDGTAVITAASYNGKTAKCTVTVSTVTGVSIGKSSLSLVQGASTALKAAVTPSNAAVKDVTWESSNPDKVFVTSYGKVIAISPTEIDETVNITATSIDNKSCIASLNVSVTAAKNYVPAANLKLTNVATGKMVGIMQVGKTAAVKALLTDAKGKAPTNKNIIWESSDKNVLSVDDNGKVTACAPGYAEITAYAADNKDIFDTIGIEVIQPVAAINMTSSVTIQEGEQAEITAAILPADVSMQGMKIEWSKVDKNNCIKGEFSDEIQEDENGSHFLKSYITGSVKGTATVNLTITTLDGTSKKAVCKVTVNPTEYGNIPQNSVNNGIAAQKDNWIYTAIDSKLYKISADGSQKIMLDEANPSFINVAGGWVYYTTGEPYLTLYKVKTDGTQKTLLNSNDPYYVVIAGDWMYYQDGSDDKDNNGEKDYSLYKMKTDGTSPIRLNDDVTFNINVVNGWIYYLNGSDDLKIYRISADGKNRQQLTEDSARALQVIGSWVYYVDASDGFRPHRMSLDGKVDMRLNDETTKGMIVSGDWIYYRNQDDGFRIYKIKLNGSEKMRLSSSQATWINIVGDWLYYTNAWDYPNIYKVKNDGNGEQRLSAEPTRKIGYVTDLGGLNAPLNKDVNNGLLAAKNYYDISVTTLTSRSNTDYAKNIDTLINKNSCSMVFASGFDISNAVQTAAEAHPEILFAMPEPAFDVSNLSNLVPVTFKEQEGSFLMGVIAGKMTKTNRIGFVGGMDIPVVQKFEAGFIAGVKSVNAEAYNYLISNNESTVRFVGDFSDKDKGRELSKELLDSGCDIIYHAAGGAGLGMFEAVKEARKEGKDVWAIGVDTDQANTSPEYRDIIISSMVKNYDRAAFIIAADYANMKWDIRNNYYNLGLNEGGVGIAQSTYEKVSEEIINLVNNFERLIREGIIIVPESMENILNFSVQR